MRAEKRLAKTIIEIGILGEPHRRTGLPPERDHGGRSGRGRGKCVAVLDAAIPAGKKLLFNEGLTA